MPTLYDLTIPAYANGLRALSGQLVKALDWGEQNGVGELQFVAARLYMGQTTNFRTPGGGFAPVFLTRSEDLAPAVM